VEGLVTDLDQEIAREEPAAAHQRGVGVDQVAYPLDHPRLLSH